jgi:uncharacterized membrane protein (UPF0127 family)
MPGYRAAHAFGSLFLLLLLSACEREVAISQPADLPVEFDTGQLLIARAAGDTVRLGVYIAETQEQTSFGLMQRPELHADSGMVFLFPRERAPTDTFYMYRTLIPLSIAFVGGDGTIGSIREMEPCTSNNSSSCPYYAAGVPCRSAVEANSGYFTRHGIKVGDRVTLQR